MVYNDLKKLQNQYLIVLRNAMIPHFLFQLGVQPVSVTYLRNPQPLGHGLVSARELFGTGPHRKRE